MVDTLTGPPSSASSYTSTISFNDLTDILVAISRRFFICRFMSTRTHTRMTGTRVLVFYCIVMTSVLLCPRRVCTDYPSQIVEKFEAKGFEPAGALHYVRISVLRCWCRHAPINRFVIPQATTATSPSRRLWNSPSTGKSLWEVCGSKSRRYTAMRGEICTCSSTRLSMRTPPLVRTAHDEQDWR